MDPVAGFVVCVVDVFLVHVELFFEQAVEHEFFEWFEGAFFEVSFFVDDEFGGRDEFEFSFLDFDFLSAEGAFGVFDAEEVPVEVHGVVEEAVVVFAGRAGGLPFAAPSDARFFAEVWVFALHVVDFAEFVFVSFADSFFNEVFVECLVEVGEVEFFFEDGFPFADFHVVKAGEAVFDGVVCWVLVGHSLFSGLLRELLFIKLADKERVRV